MPFMFVIGSCVACHAMITFNPNCVPSITVDGSREPLCHGCAVQWHAIHRPGKEPVIHPEAYEPEEVA